MVQRAWQRADAGSGRAAELRGLARDLRALRPRLDASSDAADGADVFLEGVPVGAMHTFTIPPADEAVVRTLAAKARARRQEADAAELAAARQAIDASAHRRTSEDEHLFSKTEVEIKTAELARVTALYEQAAEASLTASLQARDFDHTHMLEATTKARDANYAALEAAFRSKEAEYSALESTVDAKEAEQAKLRVAVLA